MSTVTQEQLEAQVTALKQEIAQLRSLIQLQNTFEKFYQKGLDLLKCVAKFDRSFFETAAKQLLNYENKLDPNIIK